MGKRLACNFIVFTLMLSLMLSLSLFLNACAKKGITEESVIEQKEEAAKAEEKIPSEEENLRLKAEEEKAAREARLKEEATKKEAQLREEFENVDIHFDFDKLSLTNEARKILAKKASWLQNNTNVKIQIEGHCDERGTNEYNMALGQRRANSTMKYLIIAGVKVDRISTISYGEERPVDPGCNEAAWTKNRRAHFRIISD
ncbi:MAG: peptidoglycan-associated lipoprotein Pal [Candidatus Desulfaltia sp.]|nr:peptidoglycan-associated lipoprotein Pal [Candidatus Desulfaltia sp.]